MCDPLIHPINCAKCNLMNSGLWWLIDHQLQHKHYWSMWAWLTLWPVSQVYTFHSKSKSYYIIIYITHIEDPMKVLYVCNLDMESRNYALTCDVWLRSRNSMGRWTNVWHCCIHSYPMETLVFIYIRRRECGGCVSEGWQVFFNIAFCLYSW